MGNEIPFILLPGMGADAREFAGQVGVIPGVVVPDWIAPLENESIDEYAKRFAKVIDPDGPCYIGGSSFGGFVAMELCKYLKPKACFLLGSLKGADQLPDHIKGLRQFIDVADYVPFELIKQFCKIGMMPIVQLGDKLLANYLKQLSEADANFLHWVCRAVLKWEGMVDTGGVPVYHIHGEKDLVLPVENTNPDVIIERAGHLISMSHAHAVNEFILWRIG